MTEKNKETVSIKEIAERLKVSRNYVYTVILPEIKHEKSVSGKIVINKTELCQWLTEKAVFTRQTKFISDLGDNRMQYCKILSQHNIEWKIQASNNRGKLPQRKVKPFDFWDHDLLFPKDKRFKNPETFYRAMYESAAVKIKLGERKVIFVAPALNDVLKCKKKSKPLDICQDINSQTGKKETIIMPYLYPAIDYDLNETTAQEQNEQISVILQISGQRSQINKVIDIFRSSGLNTSPKGIETKEYQDEIILKIPAASLEGAVQNG